MISWLHVIVVDIIILELYMKMFVPRLNFSVVPEKTIKTYFLYGLVKILIGRWPFWYINSYWTVPYEIVYFCVDQTSNGQQHGTQSFYSKLQNYYATKWMNQAHLLVYITYFTVLSFKQNNSIFSLFCFN